MHKLATVDRVASFFGRFYLTLLRFILPGQASLSDRAVRRVLHQNKATAISRLLAHACLRLFSARPVRE